MLLSIKRVNQVNSKNWETPVLHGHYTKIKT